jgi:2-methylcitrate dehydratase PrpD
MQAAGIQAFLDDPCLAKPFSPGKAAFNGVLSGVLAARGLSGPGTVLEGSEGYLRAYADETQIGVITDGLGDDYKLMEMGFKPHAACRYAHGPIDAAHLIRTAAGAFNPADVRRIEVRCSEFAKRQSGRVDVPNLNAAMGSTPFSVAVGVTRGSNGLNDYIVAFEDPMAHDLARRVEMIVVQDDPGMGLMGRAARVQLEMTDGRVLSQRVEGPSGDPDHPLSEERLEAKFRSLALLAVDEERTSDLGSMLKGFDTVGNVRELAELTRATKADVGVR